MATIKDTIVAAKEPLSKMLDEEFTKAKLEMFPQSIDKALYAITVMRNTLSEAGYEDSELYKLLQKSWKAVNYSRLKSRASKSGASAFRFPASYAIA